MDFGISGKVALVVGGSNGIGSDAIGISADSNQQSEIDRAVAEVTASLGAPSTVITQGNYHVRGYFDDVTDYENYVESYRAYTMS